MRCSAIIVTYNSGESIGACLEALAREECEIVVVDNASADDTVQRVEDSLPGIRCASSPTSKISASALPSTRAHGKLRRRPADPQSRRHRRAGSRRGAVALHGKHSCRCRRRRAAGNRRPAGPRLRLSPAPDAGAACLKRRWSTSSGRAIQSIAAIAASTPTTAATGVEQPAGACLAVTRADGRSSAASTSVLTRVV